MLQRAASDYWMLLLDSLVVYNYREVESTFSVLFLKLHGWLCGMVPICLIRKWKYGWFLSAKDFSLICLFFFCYNVCCLKYSAKTTDFSILNVFLHFLHQFVRTHFRIFVSVSKFHFLLAKVFHEGNFEEHFLSCGILLPYLICWRLTYLCDYLFVFSKWYV